MIKKTLSTVLCITMILCLAACGTKQESAEPVIKKLPAAETDTASTFGVDKKINQKTIDQWLGRDDVAYRDVRMLFDPADYQSIGGESDLTQTIEGFKIVPYPYIASLQALPVGNAYDGDRLFDVEWSPEGKILSATPLYEESMLILEELFPKDKAIFLMCGGGGYANMMKQILLYFGWDEASLYNIGGNWEYEGQHKSELVVYPEDKDGNKIFATWRADYAYISFEKLNPVKLSTGF